MIHGQLESCSSSIWFTHPDRSHLERRIPVAFLFFFTWRDKQGKIADKKTEKYVTERTVYLVQNSDLVESKSIIRQGPTACFADDVTPGCCRSINSLADSSRAAIRAVVVVICSWVPGGCPDVNTLVLVSCGWPNVNTLAAVR